MEILRIYIHMMWFVKVLRVRGGGKISVAGNIISLNNIDFSASPHG